jgi:hypothetical protein
MTWYVVVDDFAIDPDPQERIWTVSRHPGFTGWNTDSGDDGYGLTKADAEELANAANFVEQQKQGRGAFVKCWDALSVLWRLS